MGKDSKRKEKSKHAPADDSSQEIKAKKRKTSGDGSSQKVEASEITPQASVFNDECVLSTIVHFIGSGNFRMFAAICKSCCSAYKREFMTETTIPNAVKWGVPGVKLFHKERLPHVNRLDSDPTFCHAARQGNLEVLNWAKARFCLWNVRACEVADIYGNWKVHRWVRENEMCRCAPTWTYDPCEVYSDDDRSSSSPLYSPCESPPSPMPCVFQDYYPD